MVGTVYILHFNKKHFRAQHYVGFTTDIERRTQEHLTNNGSPLVAAARKSGIQVVLARTFENVERTFERYIKKQKNVKRFCPLCGGKHEY